jgi:hypothetical protein
MAFVNFQELPPDAPAHVRRLRIERMTETVTPRESSRRYVLVLVLLAVAALYFYVAHHLGLALDSPLLGLVVANLTFVVAVSIWSSVRREGNGRPR